MNAAASVGSTPRQRARLVIPVWGHRYAARFTELTVPALLAPGNVPHLADASALEVVVVTERDLFGVLRGAESFRQLQKCADTRLVAMDDLLSAPAYYGLTLTWSLFRGFTDLGADMTDTWLLFLNADFILADGSYRSLLPRLSGPERVVLAPSYCTIEDEVVPLLRARLDRLAQRLAIPPRELAAVTLDRLHATVRAKTVNRKMCRLERIDQFYWAVDHDTLLGRQLPISIVAMKPERVLTEPVTIWDFGTISEACPRTALAVLGDSDEFLMLELRGRNVAADQLELGWMDPAAIARDLSRWMTSDQRRCGEHTLVLHRGDLPASVDEGRRALGQFYGRVMAEASAEPQSHRDHPIWRRLHTLHDEWLTTGGHDGTDRATHAWATRAAGDRPPTERVAMGIRAAYRALFGRMPDVRPAHPSWIDLQPTLELLERLGRGAGNVVAVWSTPRAVLAPKLKERFRAVREYRTDEVDDELTGQADVCFLELTRHEILGFHALHGRLRRIVRRGGHIVVLYRTHGVEPLAARDVGFIAGALPAADAAVVWFRGGPILGRLQRRWDERLGDLRTRGRLGALRFVAWALLLAPLTYVASRAARRRIDRGEVPRGCTSVCMDITVL
ncbi:MAG TPA: hypothetical protein VK548_01500 [Candidatus Acidoferrum sp.]|nr:hypothetical protein [Candidatus Acidoferrum sp.]